MLTELTVQCWGSPRDEAGVTAHQPWPALSDPKPESAALQAMSINLAMAAAVKGVELVPTAILGTRISAVTWRSSSGRSRTSYPVGRQKSIRLPWPRTFTWPRASGVVPLTHTTRHNHERPKLGSQGRRSKPGMWAGRTTEKCLRSKVAIVLALSLSAAATIEASTVPRGRSRYAATNSAIRSQSIGATGSGTSSPAARSPRNRTSVSAPTRDASR